MKLTLYHYWRSSSSWRVRWALNHKKFEYKSVPVNLLDEETSEPTHLKRNPMGFVPVLEVDGKYLIESVAIIEWLNELQPDPPLYPLNRIEKAHCRALVEIVNAGIQPVQNLTVLDKLSDDAEKRKEWSQYFIKRGFKAFEELVKKSSGKYCIGDQLTAADLFLIPQVYNALRNDVDMKEFPIIFQINEAALKHPACLSSHPDQFKP